MGTNFYLNVVEKGATLADQLHIGKSSAGWRFALHVMPERGINDLDDWLKIIQGERICIITDEYGRILSLDELLTTITKRHWQGSVKYLRRHTDSRCISHGVGTWDCIVGDFS